MSIKQAIEALEEVADRLDGIKGGSVSESIQMLRDSIATLRLAPEAVTVDGSFPPRNIIFDSLHPDYPVEWSNPGRPAREGEVHYIRYDIYAEAEWNASRREQAGIRSSCPHKWITTQQGQTYAHLRCEKCGKTERQSWD